MKRWFSGTRAIFVVATLVTLAACQSNLDDLNDDDTNNLKDIFGRETEASVVGLSLSETVLIIGDSVPDDLARVQSTDARVMALPAGCRTVVAGSETDADGDNVPDDVTYGFDAIKCKRTLLFGRTRTLSGTVQLEDAKPANADGSYIETSGNFAFSEEIKGIPSFTETRNGTRRLIAKGAASLTRDNSLTMTLERRFLPDQRLVNQMRFVFTSAGGAVAIGSPLPAGTLEVSGGVQFSNSGAPLRGFTITTEAPLQFSPTCAEQRITGGAVLLRYARGALRIAFGSCGSPPTASRVP